MLIYQPFCYKKLLLLSHVILSVLVVAVHICLYINCSVIKRITTLNFTTPVDSIECFFHVNAAGGIL